MTPTLDRQRCRLFESRLNLNDQQRGHPELVHRILRQKTAIAPIATAQGHVPSIQHQEVDSNRPSVIH
jgi:hypothetical protein